MVNRANSDDLYYLSMCPGVLPPLRARREDIPAVTHFVDIFGRRMGRPIEEIPRKQCLPQLIPVAGIVRELQNLIERAVILSNDVCFPILCPPQKLSSAPLSPRAQPRCVTPSGL